MPIIENESNSPPYMDRSLPLGNSTDTFGRRALHVKIGNSTGEPLPVSVTQTFIGQVLAPVAITVTSTPIEAKVGATVLANRIFLTIVPTNGAIYWGTSAGVNVANGIPIQKGQPLTLSFSDAVHVFLVSSSSVDTRITEGK